MLPDVLEWLLAFVVMIVVKELVETHSWSLNPIYRDRLARAFSLTSPEQSTTPSRTIGTVVESSTVDVSTRAGSRPGTFGTGGRRTGPVAGVDPLLCCQHQRRRQSTSRQTVGRLVRLHADPPGIADARLLRRCEVFRPADGGATA